MKKNYRKVLVVLLLILLSITLFYMCIPKYSDEYLKPQFESCEVDDCIGVIIDEKCSATFEDELYGTRQKCRFTCVGVRLNIDNECNIVW